MTHHPYLERAAHILAAVALAAGLLCAVPLLDALSREPDRSWPPTELRHGRRSEGLRAQEGELVARISVPRLALDAPVYEGVKSRILASGAGHVPGTALPGEEGAINNSVIAVPRDIPPAVLADLAVGDGVEMRTRFGLKQYRVTQRRVVPPERVRFGPTMRPRVTFLIAYPLDSVGPAPLRLALILEPNNDAKIASKEVAAPSEAGAAYSPRTVRFRSPSRRAPIQLSSVSRNWESLATGRTVTSGYSEASAALPAGR